MIQRKKSLRQYSLEKRQREGRPIFDRKQPYTAPTRKPAVGRGKALQAQKQPTKRAPAPPRKALRRQSKRMAREMDAYHGQRAVFLQRYPICAACLTRGINPAPAVQIHHARGRIGKLLRDERFWIGTCAECHDWIHQNARAARELGLLAPASEFNVYPR